MHVCAGEQQEASWSMREDELGVESRYGTGRAVPSLMIREGGERDRVHRQSQTRQGAGEVWSLSRESSQEQHKTELETRLWT